MNQIRALLIFVGLASCLHGQSSVQVNADCYRDFSFTATGPSLNFDNRQSGCVIWTIAYNAAGFTALSLVVQSAPNLTTGVPGTYVTFAGTVTSGVNPNTAITQNQTNFTGYFPWLRVNLTSVTGTGLVSGKLYGFRQSPAAGSAVPNPIQVVGPDAPGVAPTSNPVQMGAVDPNLNVVTQVASNSTGNLAYLFQVTGADGFSNTLLGRLPSDTNATGNLLEVIPSVFNGTTWDRLRGNTTGLAIASASTALADDISNTQNAGTNAAGTIIYPRVMLHGFDGTNWDRVRTVAGVMTTVAGVGGIGLTDNQAGNAMAMQLNVGGIQGPLVTSGGYKYDGSAFDLARAASLLNFPVTTTLTARNSIGTQLVEKGSRWNVLHLSSADAQATASIAAEAGVRHVADCVSFSATANAAVAGTVLAVFLRDGATGAGTIIWQQSIAAEVAAGAGVQSTRPQNFCGLGLVGTTNTAMTLEFSAGVTGLVESVTLTGYNVN